MPRRKVISIRLRYIWMPSERQKKNNNREKHYRGKWNDYGYKAHDLQVRRGGNVFQRGLEWNGRK